MRDSRSLIIANYPRELALFALVIILALTVRSFAELSNLTNVMLQLAPLLLLAAGQACVLLTGGIDLSQGALMGLLSVVLVASSPRVGMPAALLLMTATAVGVGGVNGMLVARFGLSPLVATMATMFAVGGLSMYVTGGSPVTHIDQEGSLFFSMIADERILGIPTAVIIACGLLVLLWYLLRRTVLGLYIYAVGSNPSAAIVHGIPVGFVRVSAYVLSGVLTGAAATLLSARVRQGNPHLGEGMLFDSIGGAVVGGVSLAGGVGSVWAVVRGVLLLGLIQNSLYLSDLDSHIRDIAVGLLIIVAMIVGRSKERKE